jgi:hypothetical protein
MEMDEPPPSQMGVVSATPILAFGGGRTTPKIGLWGGSLTTPMALGGGSATPLAKMGFVKLLKGFGHPFVGFVKFLEKS